MSETYVESTEDDVQSILARVESVLGGRYQTTEEVPSSQWLGGIHGLEPLNREAMDVSVLIEGGIRVAGWRKRWGTCMPVDTEFFTGTREYRIDAAAHLVTNIGLIGALTVRPAFIGPGASRLPHSADDLEALRHRYRHRIAKLWPAWWADVRQTPSLRRSICLGT